MNATESEFATKLATKVATNMLIKRESSYYYRKTVPKSERDRVGMREIWLSLQTNNKPKALKLCYEIELIVAEMLDNNMVEKFDIRKYYKEKFDAVRQTKKDYKDDLIRISSKYLLDAPENIVNDFVHLVERRQEETIKKINELNNDIIKAKSEGNNEKELLLMNMLRETIAKIPNNNINHEEIKVNKKSSAKFIDTIEEYINMRKGNIGIETLEQLDNVKRLFIKFMDNREHLHEYTRKDAKQFIETLRQLPKTYGKSSKDKDKTLKQIIEEANKKDAEYLTISKEVINRHLKNLIKIWNYAISKDELEDIKENRIWENHIFDSLREKTVNKRAFKNEELINLMRTVWTSRININTVKQIIAIATYSGMRLEEICRLRPKDIEEIEGVLCFNIQVHFDKNGREIWNPKTEAGERIIPIHKALKSASLGLLERARNCEKSDKERIFFDLSYDARREKYGAGFSKRFSDFKTKAGLPNNVSFHSFRHSVRTKLGDRNGHNYPTEWIDQILGHETAGEGSRYNNGTNSKNLYKVISTLEYEDWNPENIRNR